MKTDIVITLDGKSIMIKIYDIAPDKELKIAYAGKTFGKILGRSLKTTIDNATDLITVTNIIPAMRVNPRIIDHQNPKPK